MTGPRPQPDGAFEWAEAPAGPVLVCRPMQRVARHFFTTRRWPLGSAADPDDDAAWRDVAAAIGVDDSHLARLRQVHGARAVVAHPADRPEADIAVPSAGDLALAI